MWARKDIQLRDDSPLSPAWDSLEGLVNEAQAFQTLIWGYVENQSNADTFYPHMVEVMYKSLLACVEDFRKSIDPAGLHIK